MITFSLGWVQPASTDTQHTIIKIPFITASPADGNFKMRCRRWIASDKSVGHFAETFIRSAFLTCYSGIAIFSISHFNLFMNIKDYQVVQ
jgi:hypothetical protein